ncbi:hypothetical protein [Pseudomonas capsici]|uniref:hypothetical protein n=1 Tax=Pseudomonas capsici TaxID=2810614 RepID=UPI0021F0A3B7|nr:hypothetical protein [Pseudomonas capsici]MCV4343243.1 hypothetical protein [Pseudomonas capsici]
MQMVALKEFRYAGQQLLPGDAFEACERDVRLLKAIKNARLDGESDASTEQEQKGSPILAKRIYKRRDMKAE